MLKTQQTNKHNRTRIFHRSLRVRVNISIAKDIIKMHQIKITIYFSTNFHL